MPGKDLLLESMLHEIHVIKFLVAYRMQLFMYLKGMGRTDLGTPQCWLGADPDEKA